MRKILSAILFLTLLMPLGIKAEYKNDSVYTLQTFIKNNPKCYSKEIFYEGCKVLLCSDGGSMLVQFKVRHPAIQMRVLMQGITFYIDPTGRKKEKYSIILPAAKEVKEQMQMMRPQMQRESVMQMERPDIQPLIKSLSQYGAILDVNGKSNFINNECFVINLDEADESIVYTVLVPIEQMLGEKKLSDRWRLGLYSQGGIPSEDGPDFGERPELGRSHTPRQHSTDNRHRADAGKDIRDILIKDIEEWIDFSFSEICSLNN